MQRFVGMTLYILGQAYILSMHHELDIFFACAVAGIGGVIYGDAD